MSADELQDLEEHADEGAHHPSMAPVTVTMAVLAVLVAAVSLLGHRAHTEEILLQNRASDKWAYNQAKDTRRHTYELFLDLMSISDMRNAPGADKIRQK